MLSGTLTNTGECQGSWTAEVEKSGGAAGHLVVEVDPSGAGLAPGGSIGVSVTVTADCTAVPETTASVTVRYRSQSQGQCGADSHTCSVTFQVTIGEVDLDVDSNNNGTIDANNDPATGTDDPIEEGNPSGQFTADKPGNYVWMNNDDSDNDAISDNDDLEVNGQADLADLRSVVVRPLANGLAAEPRLKLRVDNPNLIRIFRDFASDSEAIIGPGIIAPPTDEADITDYAMGGHVFAYEGVAAGTTLIHLELYDGDSGPLVCQDTVRVTIVDLRVHWATVADPASDITEVNQYYYYGPGGIVIGPQPLGLTWYPDASSAGGNWNERVAVRIETVPTVNNATVYLKAVDPDDPSANSNEVDGNTLGGDNRGSSAHLDAGSTRTMTSLGMAGIAVVNFTVAHQPGDNHRVAATLKQGALNDTNHPVNNDTVHPSSAPAPANDQQENQPQFFPGHLSPLLTIWRKIHYQSAAMQRPTFAENTWSGNWSNPHTWTDGQGQQIQNWVVFDVGDQPQWDTNQLASGLIRIQAPGLNLPTYHVITNNHTGPNSDSITVSIQGGMANLGGIASGTFVVPTTTFIRRTTSICG
jgi:hypothetical protein